MILKVRSLGHFLPSVKVGWKTGSKLEDLDDLIMFRPLLEQMLDGTYWSCPTIPREAAHSRHV